MQYLYDPYITGHYDLLISTSPAEYIVCTYAISVLWAKFQLAVLELSAITDPVLLTLDF